MRVAAAVATALVAAIVTAGCGVGTEAGPERIKVATSLTSPTNHRGPSKARQAATIYLVEAGHLVGVNREVPQGSGVDGLLRALESAPSHHEAERGLGSSLPTGGGQLRITISDGIATVTVPAAYQSLGLVQQIFAVAQIVYTVTSIDGIDSVVLAQTGHAIDVPTGSGVLSSKPVTRSDYSSIASAKSGS